MNRVEFDGISDVKIKTKERRQVVGTFDTLDKAQAVVEPGDYIVIKVNGVEQYRLKVMEADDEQG